MDVDRAETDTEAASRRRVETTLRALLALANDNEPLSERPEVALLDEYAALIQDNSTHLGGGTYGQALRTPGSVVRMAFGLFETERESNDNYTDWMVVKVSNVRRFRATLELYDSDSHVFRESAVGLVIDLRRRAGSLTTRRALAPIANVKSFRLWSGSDAPPDGDGRLIGDFAVAWRVQCLRLARRVHELGVRSSSVFLTGTAPSLSLWEYEELHRDEQDLLQYYNAHIRLRSEQQLDRMGADYTMLLPDGAAAELWERNLPEELLGERADTLTRAALDLEDEDERRAALEARYRDLYFYFEASRGVFPLYGDVAYGPVLAIAQPLVDGLELHDWAYARGMLYHRHRVDNDAAANAIEREFLIVLRAVQVILERLHADAGVYHRDLNASNVMMRRLPLNHPELRADGAYGSIVFYDDSGRQLRLQPDEWPRDPDDKTASTVLVPHLIDFGRASLTTAEPALFAGADRTARANTVDGRVAPMIDLQQVVLGVAHAIDGPKMRPRRVCEFFAAAFTWSEAQVRLLDDPRRAAMSIDQTLFDFHLAHSHSLLEFALECVQFVHWALHGDRRDIPTTYRYLRRDQPMWCLQLHQLADIAPPESFALLHPTAWRCLAL